MAERERMAGLAEQIELARKSIEEWPEWLRSSAHFSGTNHPDDSSSAAAKDHSVDDTNHLEPHTA